MGMKRKKTHGSVSPSATCLAPMGTWTGLGTGRSPAEQREAPAASRASLSPSLDLSQLCSAGTGKSWEKA